MKWIDRPEAKPKQTKRGAGRPSSSLPLKRLDQSNGRERPRHQLQNQNRRGAVVRLGLGWGRVGEFWRRRCCRCDMRLSACGRWSRCTNRSTHPVTQIIIRIDRSNRRAGWLAGTPTGARSIDCARAEASGGGRAIRSRRRQHAHEKPPHHRTRPALASSSLHAPRPDPASLASPCIDRVYRRPSHHHDDHQPVAPRVLPHAAAPAPAPAAPALPPAPPPSLHKQ